MLLLLLLAGAAAAAAVSRPWMRTSDSPRDRALALLQVMNTSEKIAMLHGYDDPEYTGFTRGNARLGIPSLNFNDGRQGFRPNDRNSRQTAFPCQLATVATFDKDLFRAFGEAMGEEFVGKGSNVMLAPMLILARVPQGGRNFESTGEDSELAYHFAFQMVSGAQAVPGLIANADDFVLNNQETDRGDISSVADGRTLFELYYRGYKGAIDAGVGSFMCSYVSVLLTSTCRQHLEALSKSSHTAQTTHARTHTPLGRIASMARTRARTPSRWATSSPPRA